MNFDIGPWVNWDSLYIAYLPKIIDTKNTLEFYFLLMEYCAHLHDGHTGIIFPKELQNFIKGRIPIQTRFIEDKIVVTKVYKESLRNEGVLPGLEVVEIDGLLSNKYAEKFTAQALQRAWEAFLKYWYSEGKDKEKKLIEEMNNEDNQKNTLVTAEE